MKSSRITIMLSALALAAVSSAQWSGIPIDSFLLTGDYSTTGHNTRTAATGGGPVSLTTSSVAGATYVKTYAVWNFLSDSIGPDPLESMITIDAIPVFASGFATDVDLCWGKAATNSYIADVSGIVTGDGTYSVDGVSDKPDVTGATSLGEGVSFLTVYSHPSIALRSVDVYFGNVGDDGTTGFASGGMAFSSAYLGGDAHFFLNGMDGQDFADDFFLNGGPASAFPGLFGPGDAWSGTLGIGDIGGGGTGYDHAEGDASGFMTVGDGGIFFDTAIVGDCIGHSFGAMSFHAVPEPATFAVLGLGLVPFLRRRKK